jgi:hypothetical protein
MTALWRDDLDALQFDAGEGRLCMMHRLAFRALIGQRSPLPDQCLAYFNANQALFARAAKQKIARAGGCAGNFHINSRDVQGAVEPAS